MVNRWDENRVGLTHRFFLAMLIQSAAAATIAIALRSLNGLPVVQPVTSLPTAFQFSTLFLAVGSWFMHRAVQLVRIERQAHFRISLMLALLSAILFVGIQSYGLWAFVKSVPATGWTQTDVNGFVFVATALHAMHFLVAQSILLWIWVCAESDRYDHEYHWGVIFAAWCWHALGAVWIVIVVVFGIAFPSR